MKRANLTPHFAEERSLNTVQSVSNPIQLATRSSFFSKLNLILIILAISLPVVSQTKRSDRRSNEPSRTERGNSNNSYRNPNYSQKSEVKNNPKSSNNDKYDRKSDDRNHTMHNNDKNWYYSKEKSYSHNNNNNRYYKHQPKYRPNNHHMFRHELPSPKYITFNHGGRTYYHCHNTFYEFVPSYGYLAVNAPMGMIAQLPYRYQTLIIEGNRYYYANGNYYIPCEYGFMPVEMAQRPQFSFHINF